MPWLRDNFDFPLLVYRDGFESGLQSDIESLENHIRDDMRTFAQWNTVTVEVSIRFAKGYWSL